MADAAASVATTMRSLREEAVQFCRLFGRLREDMDALRAVFAGADAELEALRTEFIPEVRGPCAARGSREIRTLLDALDTDDKDMGHRLTSEVASLHATIQVLVPEADDMRQVVEPLQSATERVGRVADRLPGGGS
jgi:hypothetical protein